MSEFAHRLTLDRIRGGERIDLVADADERAAVATRLGLLALDRFDAHAVLGRDGNTVTVAGRIKATLAQACVASSEPVPEHVDEAFNLRFVPAPTVTAPEEELELGGDDLDTLFYDGAAIDLGEAIADSLALAIDPYPRSPAAAGTLKQAGVLSEEEAGPFAALAALKQQMSGSGDA